jgi:hypothetical protein
MPAIVENKGDRGAVSAARPTGLAALGLTEEDLRVLSRQGFVSCENRPGKPPLFKLRFRREGQQVVRCIGFDARRAEELREELAAIQGPRKGERRLSALTRQARRMLRTAKSETEPALNEAGFRFHGLAIRRQRPTGGVGHSQ